MQLCSVQLISADETYSTRENIFHPPSVFRYITREFPIDYERTTGTLARPGTSPASPSCCQSTNCGSDRQREREISAKTQKFKNGGLLVLVA